MSKGLALNTKTESIDIDTRSQIDQEIVASFVKRYEVLLKENFG